jgi:hypothetical protein
MKNDREIAARGSVGREATTKEHHEGFNEALQAALRDLDGPKYAGQELEVRQVIEITPNPGGIGQYKVELVPKG